MSRAPCRCHSVLNPNVRAYVYLIQTIIFRDRSVLVTREMFDLTAECFLFSTFRNLDPGHSEFFFNDPIARGNKRANVYSTQTVVFRDRSVLVSREMIDLTAKCFYFQPFFRNTDRDSQSFTLNDRIFTANKQSIPTYQAWKFASFFPDPLCWGYIIANVMRDIGRLFCWLSSPV